MRVERGHRRRVGGGGAEADEAVRPDEDGAPPGAPAFAASNPSADPSIIVTRPSQRARIFSKLGAAPNTMR